MPPARTTLLLKLLLIVSMLIAFPSYLSDSCISPPSEKDNFTYLGFCLWKADACDPVGLRIEGNIPGEVSVSISDYPGYC